MSSKDHRGHVATEDKPAYQLTTREHHGYLYARATGPRTAENAQRFLREAYEACVKEGYPALLLEMSLTGPALDMASVFRVIANRAPDGAKLRRIAYIEPSPTDLPSALFAETVANNRGVNVRLFKDVERADRWLTDGALKEKG
jgi:hypothetical protein